MVKKNCCVFISGAGSNLNALIKTSREYNFPINIKLVISNKRNPGGRSFAKKYSIPFKFINFNDKLFEVKVLNILNQYKIKLVCLAGFMKIISDNFIKSYNGTIINIHPSLLPKYKGVDTFSRVLANKEKSTGCTVHYVNDKLDSGKIILQKSFTINNNDTLDSLRKKTQIEEYKTFSKAITKVYLMN